MARPLKYPPMLPTGREAVCYEAVDIINSLTLFRLRRTIQGRDETLTDHRAAK